MNKEQTFNSEHLFNSPKHRRREGYPVIIKGIEVGDYYMLGSIGKLKDLKNLNNSDLDKLWSEIRKGQEDSLSELFCHSYTWLFNYGYKIVPRKAFIKDTLQELFLNLWKNRNSIKEAHSVKSYLLSSLRRIIFRKLRKHRNRTERNHTYKQNLFEEILNIEELMVHFELEQNKRDQLTLAIKSLSKRQREAVHLKFYNGLSNSEIAQVMNINKQSVYNHISKAIKNMQEIVSV